MATLRPYSSSYGTRDTTLLYSDTGKIQEKYDELDRIFDR